MQGWGGGLPSRTWYIVLQKKSPTNQRASTFSKYTFISRRVGWLPCQRQTQKSASATKIFPLGNTLFQARRCCLSTVINCSTSSISWAAVGRRVLSLHREFVESGIGTSAQRSAPVPAMFNQARQRARCSLGQFGSHILRARIASSAQMKWRAGIVRTCIAANSSVWTLSRMGRSWYGAA